MVAKTTSFVLFALAGILIAIMCLLGFVSISELRYFFLVAFGMLTFGLFFFAAKVLDANSALLLRAIVAVSSVFAEQILAFSFFSGLVKDLELLSWDHIRKLGLVLVVVCGFYLGVAVLALALVRLRNQ